MPFAFDLLETSYPPAAAAFAAPHADLVRRVCAMLRDAGGVFTVNVYPWFAYRATPGLSLGYALLNEPHTVGGVTYANLLVAQVSDVHENGSNVLVGVGGGSGCLSLSGTWRVTEGHGKWGAWHVFWHRCGTMGRRHAVPTQCKDIPRDAFDWKGPQMWSPKRLDRRLEEVAKAVGGGYCRLQLSLRLSLAVRACRRGTKFFYPICVYSKCSDLWLGIQMWVKNTKKNSTPCPDLQVGPWLLAHPSVTCHWSLEAGGGGGGAGGWRGPLCTSPAQVAAVRAALLRLDPAFTAAALPVVVGETGWPTAGHPDATVRNAATYANNVVRLGLDGVLGVHLFEAFDERGKRALPGTLQDDTEEKNFGLLRAGRTPKYDIPALRGPGASGGLGVGASGSASGGSSGSSSGGSSGISSGSLSGGPSGSSSTGSGGSSSATTSTTSSGSPGGSSDSSAGGSSAGAGGGSTSGSGTGSGVRL